MLGIQQQLNVDCANIYKMLTNLIKSLELTLPTNVYPALWTLQFYKSTTQHYV
jgi:hypothetical protein